MVTTIPTPTDAKAEGKTLEKVDLYGFTYWYVQAKIRGITDLLQHAPTAMQPKSRGRGKEIPEPEEEAERGLYRLESGELYVPAIAIRNCLLNGASRGEFKVGRKSLKSLLSAGILIEPNELVLVREGAPVTTWDIDIRRAVVQGNAVHRARPKIQTPWEVSFELFIDTQLYRTQDSLSQIVDLFRFAGRFIGIGDYRPEKTGWFGQFIPDLPIEPASK